MNLVLGYNGFSRFLGHNHHGANPFELPEGYVIPAQIEHGLYGGNGPGAVRLFDGEVGLEISWLLPAALLALLLVLVSRGRAPRTDPVRAVAVLFGLWIIIDGVSLSVMQGGMHAYYTLAIAPAIAGMFAVGLHEMWRRRAESLGRLGLAVLIGASGVWGFALLRRNADWQPWLRWTVLAATVVTVAGLLAAAIPAVGSRRSLARPAAVLAVLGVLAGLGGSAAYAVATIPVEHVGGSPSVGPAQAKHHRHSLMLAAIGSFLEGVDNPQLDAMLDRTHTRWAAAVERSSVAANLELSSHASVMAIGGFTDEDPTPTLAQFQEYVRDHEITYYIAQNVILPPQWRTGKHTGGGQQISGVRRPGPGGWWPGDHRDIADWVAEHFSARNMGNVTVYDLTRPKI
jgi:4-amino-4-deoxy-L-arabinose transferase-like glycosyltransferase